MEFCIWNYCILNTGKTWQKQICLDPFWNNKNISVLFLLSAVVMKLFFIIVIFLFFLEGVSCWRRNLKKCISSRELFSKTKNTRIALILFIYVHYFSTWKIMCLQRSQVRIFLFSLCWLKKNPKLCFCLFTSRSLLDGTWQLTEPRNILSCCIC